MLGESSGEAVSVAAAHEDGEFGMEGLNPGEEDKERADEGDRSFGGNRWPRQETLALLKIRSDMNTAFRDSSPKGPLWEAVSRKLAELGYNRSAKKCKEKFENVFKYHKRTKDSRTGKSETKAYKFFDQLQALENLHPHKSPSPPKPQTPMPTTVAALPWSTNVPVTTAVSSINIVTNPINTITIPQNTTNPTTNAYPNALPSSFQNISSSVFSTSTSSSTASEESGGSSKRKRKWKEFFKRLTKEVIEKQEELQRKFLEAVEKQENERMMREETWRIQEMARINKEHEILVQERSTAAAKDAAVIAFLQKISGQQNANSVEEIRVTSLQPLPAAPLPPVPSQQKLQTPPPPPPKVNNGDNAVLLSSPSRWPKAEVEALIKLRTGLDTKYQDGPKAPLWEEISGGMRRLGYNRRAKRCKEKWENINKYFKKVKESNKERPEDSKTCPYFHQLDAIYREKNKNEMNVPLMVQPEQQWPPQQELIGERIMELDNERENLNLEDEDDGETEEEKDEGSGYKLVANKTSSAPNGSGE
ncbi:hypothetical protein SLA2020_068190 [Shorea laevis]